MTSELSKFGAEFIIEDDSLTVIKSDLHKPSEVLFGHNDHRVVMALSVICSVLGGEISGAEAVNKSYPDFFNDLTLLGIMHLDG
jgi:3-phosphoshikimate 1-carboxyvinyltransferase